MPKRPDFKSNIKLPQSGDRWDLVEVLHQTIHELVTPPRPIPVSVQTEDYTLDEESVAVARAEVERDHATVKNIHVIYWPMQQDSLWVRFMVFFDTDTCLIDVSGGTEAHTRGIHGALADRVNRWVWAQEKPEVAAPSVPVAQPVVFVPAAGGTPATKPDEPKAVEDTAGWMRRTWRDHTMGFMITVVAGLLVIIVAAYLGFGS